MDVSIPELMTSAFGMYFTQRRATAHDGLKIPQNWEKKLNASSSGNERRALGVIFKSAQDVTVNCNHDMSVERTETYR